MRGPSRRVPRNLVESQNPATIGRWSRPLVVHGNITNLVNRLSRGELLSRDDMFGVVYSELRGMARRSLRSDAMKSQVAPTELVHQVFVKLFGNANLADGEDGKESPDRWANRAHFYGSAARAMEQVLIDAARRDRTRRKHMDGRGLGLLGGDDGAPQESPNGDAEGANLDVTLLADALRELEAQDPALAELVRLRVYLGHTAEATAQTMKTSIRSVHRDWALARAWLLKRMKMKCG